MAILRFLFKSSVVGGVFYYISRQGVWGDQDESVKVYTKIYDTVAPYLRENVPQEVIQEVDKLPNSGDLKRYVVRYWNTGVIASMGFIANLPTHVSNGSKSLVGTVQKLMEDQK